ncbi:hypothetical protein [Burkholderia sp. Ac-20344]|uniref:hypothetical protein n=1 Tax=Burkholderia sp. Ac-20344 TaxID=2703890 RepID=UPI001F11C07D|nr:hypothetical protein [Burkholderia sp. Ac-20344]
MARTRAIAPEPARRDTGIFNDPFGAAHDRPEVHGFVDTMRSMLNAHGLTPDAFAERVFDGIRAGRYWLMPQPETIDGALPRRTDDILASRDPSLPSFCGPGAAAAPGARRHMCVPACVRPLGSPPRSGGVLF